MGNGLINNFMACPHNTLPNVPEQDFGGRDIHFSQEDDVLYCLKCRQEFSVRDFEDHYLTHPEFVQEEFDASIRRFEQRIQLMRAKFREQRLLYSEAVS